MLNRTVVRSKNSPAKDTFGSLPKEEKTIRRTSKAVRNAAQESKAKKKTRAKSDHVEVTKYRLTDRYNKIEFRDAWDKLKQKSEVHRVVLEVIHDDSSVYTLRGRLNKSRVCSQLGIKPKDLNQVLADAQAHFGTAIVERITKKPRRR